ncbi:WD40 repeat domain-containing serine/threonine protein kinase [Paludisphaera soli]|uniref:WD40 repeat domain-containing serine/threonine protein kinase n=1 Tax=Paludisphaera soli TaxID=2712865 RepID=UPI0013ECA675|nr:protein kinase [Paludisphaera soli]
MSTSAPQNESHRRRRAACERLKERIRSERSTRVEHLLAEDPELARDDDALLELILAETDTRRELGETATVAEWEERIRGMIPDPHRRRSIQALLSTEMVTLSESTLTKEARAAIPVAPRGRVGRYHILEEVGRGGMGVVYKARQLSPRRIVAIKMILAGDHANARERARLRTEAEAAAKLTHPNIVQIIEADYHEGLPFLAMEFVDGGNLARMLRAMPQPIRWSARMIETLARAIHEAHESDIVHRDLNPSNILMTQDGVPKIGDFGLAKFLMTDEGTSQSGRLLGTPSYMAPEQLGDGGRGVSRRTDVYGLGAILYEMLTGSPPFRGLTPMETLCQVAEGDVVPPSRLRHGLPQDLETICLKCLDRNPSARYVDARELADDLRRFQDREPIHARRTPRLRRALQWASREPVASGLLILSFLLLLSLLSVASVYSIWLTTAQYELESRYKQLAEVDYSSQITKVLTERSVEDARRERYGYELGRIHDHALRNQTELAVEAFDILRRTAPRKLGFEWAYVDRLIHRSARILGGEAGHMAPVGFLCPSRDGRTLVSGDEGGKVLEWDLASRSPKALAPISGEIPVRGLATAGDATGRTAVVAAVQVEEDRAFVNLWDLRDAEGPWSFQESTREVAEVGFARGGSLLAVRCREGPGAAWRTIFFAEAEGSWSREAAELADVSCAAFAPDAGAMALGRGDGSILVRGRADGEDLALLPREPSRPVSLAFSSDGAWLACGWEDGRVIVWDVRTGDPASMLDCVDGPPTELAFCLGGRGLVIREGPQTLALHDLRGDGSRRVLEGPDAIPTSLGVSPDGDSLVAAYESRPVRIWDLADRSATPAELLELGSPSRLRFSPADRTLFMNFNHESILLWTLPAAPHPRTSLGGHQKEAWSLAFSPDGSILASGADDHQIRLWNVADGSDLGAIEAHSQTVTGLSFSPDGEELASVSLDGSWKIWRLVRDAPEPPHVRLEHARTLREPGRSQLRCVAHSLDGGLIAASGLTPDILIYDTTSYAAPKVIAGAHSEMITALAFSYSRPSMLASAGCDRRLRLWDPQVGDRISDLPVNGPLMTLAYSPVSRSDNALLAASGDQRLVSVWDVGMRNALKPVRGHPAAIRSLAFTHDGVSLATGCDDGAVRICDAETRQVVLVLEGHHGRINAVAFSPDDQTLASCSHSGEVFLWRAGPASR